MSCIISCCYKKDCFFIAHCIVILVLFSSCSSIRLISNSNGYDYNTNRNELLIKEQPDWLNKGMYQETLPDGNYFYVVGSYLGNIKEVNADKADIAESKAVIDAKTQVAGYLFSEVAANSADIITEENQAKEITVNGKTKSVSRGESYDSMYIDSYIKSAASFSGLVLNDRFFNLIEDTKKNKRYYNYWCRFRISEENLKKAQEEIEEKKNLASDERTYFAQLKTECLYTIRLLQNTDFLEQEDQFKSLYFELVSLNSELRNLTYFGKQDLADANRRDYESLVKHVAEILDEYDPSDIQKQQYLFKIRTLEQALQEKSGEAENLGAEIIALKNNYTGLVQNLEENIAQKTQEIETTQQLMENLRLAMSTEQNTTHQNRENEAVQDLVDSLREEIADLQKTGIRLISTNIYAVYPGKPEFTFSRAGFSLTSGAVTNREFISFLTMTGNPDYSLAEDGLDKSVSCSFLDGAAYCNWLSRLYSLPEFYSIQDGAVQCNNNGGYRLPFEEELEEVSSAKFRFDSELAGSSVWSCTSSGTPGSLYSITADTGEIQRQESAVDGSFACLIITKNND